MTTVIKQVFPDWNAPQQFTADCPLGWEKDAQCVIVIPNNAKPGAARIGFPAAAGFADFRVSANLTTDPNDWSPHMAMSNGAFNLWVEGMSPATTPPTGAVAVTPGSTWYVNCSVQNIAKHPGPGMTEVAIKFELAPSH